MKPFIQGASVGLLIVCAYWLACDGLWLVAWLPLVISWHVYQLPMKTFALILFAIRHPLLTYRLITWSRKLKTLTKQPSK